jgi:hypothetical protein
VSTLTLVLWLQSGRKFQEVVVSADRPPVVHLLPRYDSGGVVMPHDLDLHAQVDRLAFELTVPHAIADAEYDVGRRRFHYRETTGWVSPEERYERDRRDRDGRHPDQGMFDKIADQVAKHRALLTVGAFPVHGCALPEGYGLELLLGCDCSTGAWTTATYSAASAAPLTLAKLEELYRNLLNGGPLG